MAIQLSDAQRQVFAEPNFGHLATIMLDGSPQVTTVWVDYDGRHVIINTAEGRQKVRNMRRDSRVALDVNRQDRPYMRVSVRGRVVEVTADGAEDHIHKLSRKYTGRDYTVRPGEQRLIVKIEPLSVSGQGLG